jgi:hypothetical protein
MKKLIVPAFGIALAAGVFAVAGPAPQMHVAYSTAPVTAGVTSHDLLARTGDVYLTQIYTKAKAAGQVSLSAADLDK